MPYLEQGPVAQELAFRGVLCHRGSAGTFDSIAVSDPEARILPRGKHPNDDQGR